MGIIFKMRHYLFMCAYYHQSTLFAQKQHLKKVDMKIVPSCLNFFMVHVFITQIRNVCNELYFFSQ
jgi:hypothetical protein